MVAVGEETVLYLSDNMRMYERETPSELRVQTFLGRVLVTTDRFLFLSSGSNKLLETITTKLEQGEGTLSNGSGRSFFVGRAKHDAWAGLSGTPRDEAMESYIELVEGLKAG